MLYRCPNCKCPCYRESADVGIGIIYGPYCCPDCGWSEDERYNIPRSNRNELRCFRCRRSPDEIEDYVESAKELGITPVEFVVREEVTLNREERTFCCTKCYIQIGMPSRPYPGWKAPALGARV